MYSAAQAQNVISSAVKLRHLVLLGGGHAHIGVLRMLGMHPEPDLKVTLVSPSRETPYSGLLPGVVGGHSPEQDLYIDLGRLCQFAGADLVLATATAIDPGGSEIELRNRPNLAYDYLSIDVGIEPALTDLAEFDEALVPVKPIAGFMARFNLVYEQYRGGGAFAIVGAGAAGLELAFALNHRLGIKAEKNGLPKPVLYLCQAAAELLPEAPPRLRAKAKNALAAQGIQFQPQFRAVRQGAGQLASASGAVLEVDQVFWATGAAPQAFLQNSDLAGTPSGYIAVNAQLQSVSHPNVFAVGDAADMVEQARPKAGVYAVRQVPVLFQNLVRMHRGQSLIRFKPQQRVLSLISLGEQTALGYKGPFWGWGRSLWRLKRRIDYKFLDSFKNLPLMMPPSVSNGEALDPNMQCRGCGAKVASSILSEVLSELDPDGGRVLDDSAVLIPPAGELMIQSVDAFRPIIDDPYVLAKIAVVHAVSDIYAMGGRVGPIMVNLTLPYGSESITRSLLQQVMAGVLSQTKAEGGQLVGGHTAEGLELNITVSVTGWAPPDDIRTSRGTQLDDHLVLTKALGTGTLFAASMRGQAAPSWISHAVAMMLQSNRPAGALIAAPSVHAVTDVTGFGLAGHLQGMLAAGQGVDLILPHLPVLNGALTSLSELGVYSTAHDKNQRAATLVRTQDFSDPELLARQSLLFDPQTSGGLLISVAPDASQDLVARLKASGFDQAAVIGSITDQAGIAVSAGG
ncbi:MAG TPA: selenide, water dikinase SelD [Gammaproteobacteria bacterium]|nr:selenide, water dikinase SelD [Gammaproteobacteria bacterium]